MNYVTKAVKVKAFQHNGDIDNYPQWFKDEEKVGRASVTESDKYGRYISLKANGGGQKAELSDWIVNQDGHILRIPDGIFINTYEREANEKRNRI